MTEALARKATPERLVIKPVKKKRTQWETGM
jgi:hypothetical protein